MIWAFDGWVVNGPENHVELLREIKPLPFLALRYADEMDKKKSSHDKLMFTECWVLVIKE